MCDDWLADSWTFRRIGLQFGEQTESQRHVSVSTPCSGAHGGPTSRREVRDEVPHADSSPGRSPGRSDADLRVARLRRDRRGRVRRRRSRRRLRLGGRLRARGRHRDRGLLPPLLPTGPHLGRRLLRRERRLGARRLALGGRRAPRLGLGPRAPGNGRLLGPGTLAPRRAARPGLGHGALAGGPLGRRALAPCRSTTRSRLVAWLLDGRRRVDRRLVAAGASSQPPLGQRALALRELDPRPLGAPLPPRWSRLGPRPPRPPRLGRRALASSAPPQPPLGRWPVAPRPLGRRSLGPWQPQRSPPRSGAPSQPCGPGTPRSPPPGAPR